jgi:ABC-type uncharacterized transport system permease subunit
MNGVEILNQSNIYETDVYWWILIVCAGAGLLGGLIASIKEWINYGFDASYVVMTVMMTLACSFAGLIFTLASEHETETIDYIEYKVTASEDVTLNDFLDKYEILDQEGKIYIVKEKEQC